MANTLRLEIVTPLEEAYSEDVQMVVLPGVEGEMGIYPMHIPVMTEIKPGELKILKDGIESDFAVGEGFVEITQTKVTVLTDLAIGVEAIDEKAVERAIERAQSALRNAEALKAEEIAAAEATLQRSFVQLRLKRKTK
ncbi:MAG: ATP synthase F1 subunit epsilon [Chthoniobacteraceae bacterium]|nr:ATP synthase F1 subunit epsilon [Chthoniobacteraceae bacterium]